MATYVVTPANWNDPAFWSSISTSNYDTLDLTALDSSFSITIAVGPGIIEISDPTASFTIGSPSVGGTDANLASGSISHFDIIDGSDGVENLTWGGDNNDFALGGGDDVADAGGGTNTVDGGAGNDTITAGSGTDTLFGGTGDDTITSGGGTDTVQGGAGDDSIDGGAGADTLYGNSGSDRILGGDNDDVIYGDNPTPPENLIVNGSFEDLTGTVPVGYGDLGVGSITGWTDYNGGDFDLHTNGKGGTFATDGTHVLDMGGSPSNLHVYQDVAGVVTGETYTLTFDAGDVFGGGNAVEVYWGGELVATVDPVEGGMESFTFELTGGAGDGSNRLEFREIGPIDVDGVQLDNVQLFAAPGGADDLHGGAGNDTIFGNEGDDTITGGTGDDELYGGAGDDTFVIEDGGGTDAIEDFDMGDSDGDGFTNDQVDVSGMTTGNGPGGAVRFWDVTLSEDLGGNAVLSFPDGTSITLKGVTMDEVDSIAEMASIGIPCFTPGTLIQTAEGAVPVEDIRPGDRLVTRDNGLQPVLWAGRRSLGADDLRAAPELRPVLVRKGAVGNARRLWVSPQHGFLRDGRLLRARHMAEVFGPQMARIDVDARTVDYIHLLTPRHELILAEGAWSETFYPGPMALMALGWRGRVDLARAVPALAPALMDATARPATIEDRVARLYGPPARPYLLRRNLVESANGARAA